MKPVYQRIEDIRISKGVTKTHIAKSCGKTVSWYYGISVGRRTPDVHALQEIADVLEVDVRIFFGNGLSETLSEGAEEIT